MQYFNNDGTTLLKPQAQQLLHAAQLQYMIVRNMFEIGCYILAPSHRVVHICIYIYTYINIYIYKTKSTHMIVYMIICIHNYTYMCVHMSIAVYVYNYLFRIAIRLQTIASLLTMLLAADLHSPSHWDQMLH